MILSDIYNLNDVYSKYLEEYIEIENIKLVGWSVCEVILWVEWDNR